MYNYKYIILLMCLQKFTFDEELLCTAVRTHEIVV